MYSFTRVWMGPKLATMLISVSSVVSSTSTSEMPSTPTLYSMPKKPIQSTSWTSWKPGRSASKESATSREMTQGHAGRERRQRTDGTRPARPARRPARWRPTSGAEDEQREQVRAGQEVVEHQRAMKMKSATMAERARGRCPARSSGRGRSGCGGCRHPRAGSRAPVPLTMPSMTRTSNHMTRVGDGPAEAVEDEVVEVVEPPLAGARPRTGSASGGCGR